MASRIWAVALGVMTLTASCTAGCSGGGRRPWAGRFRRSGLYCQCVRVASSSAGKPSIDTQLRGTAVGYVALVGQSHSVASGLARKATDPPKLAMGPDVMVNVASVGKMFTTIAVLKSLASHHLSIDSRISPFLPPDWVKGPGIDTITFRELLTHRAGFRLDTGLVFATDNAAKEQIRQKRRPAGGQAGAVLQQHQLHHLPGPAAVHGGGS